MYAIYKRELNSYFKNPIGYIFCAFMLAMVGLLSINLNFQGHNTSFSGILPSVAAVLSVAVPILTMRTAADEKAQKTDKLFYTLPIPMRSIVAGKYLAALTVFALPCAFMCLYPLIMSVFGTVRFANEYSSLLAFFLLGAVFISIGLFISCLTDNQMTSAFISIAALIVICLIPRLMGFVPASPMTSLIIFIVMAVALGLGIMKLTKNNAAGLFSGGIAIIAVLLVYVIKKDLFKNGFAKVMNFISVYSRFNDFIYGVFDIRTVLYFISLSAMFLFLSEQALEKARWN